VLGPIDRIRQLIEQMERGHWRTPPSSGAPDEVGALLSNFHRLGMVIDALACHGLHAERLATLALVATTLAREVEPHVERLGVAAAAAAILQATRRLNRGFELIGGGRAQKR
jgi:hypothetical protein